MNVTSAPIYDNDSNVVGTLNLVDAVWQRGDGDSGDQMEVAFVRHTDGETYVVLGYSAQPDGPVNVYTQHEWEAFLKGASAGEFSTDAHRPQT
jgi:hypothetical protein